MDQYTADQVRTLHEEGRLFPLLKRRHKEGSAFEIVAPDGSVRLITRRLLDDLLDRWDDYDSLPGEVLAYLFPDARVLHHDDPT